MSEPERLTKLEERYAHLQRHMLQQDKAMLELADELAKLRKEVALLGSQRNHAGQTDEPGDERPPHY